MEISGPIDLSKKTSIPQAMRTHQRSYSESGISFKKGFRRIKRTVSPAPPLPDTKQPNLQPLTLPRERKPPRPFQTTPRGGKAPIPTKSKSMFYRGSSVGEEKELKQAPSQRMLKTLAENSSDVWNTDDEDKVLSEMDPLFALQADYHELAVQVDRGLQVFGKVTTLFQRFCSIEANFGEQLEKLGDDIKNQVSSTNANAIGNKAHTATIKCINLIRKMGNLHKTMARTLSATTLSRMQQFHKESEQEKNEIIAKQDKCTDKLNTEAKLVQKSKQKAHKRIESFAKSKDNLDKADESVTSKAKQRLLSGDVVDHNQKPTFLKTDKEKLKQLRETTKAQKVNAYDACRQHQHDIKKLNLHQHLYFNSSLPLSLHQMEILSENWVTQLKTNFLEFGVYQQKLCEDSRTTVEDFLIHSSEIDIPEITNSRQKRAAKKLGVAYSVGFSQYDLPKTHEEIEKMIVNDVPLFSRPTLTEALHQNKILCSYYEEFLKKSFCSENIIFTKSVLSYQGIPEFEERKLRAQTIYDNFIAAEAPACVNLPHETKVTILNTLNDAPKDLFDQALDVIIRLQEADAFPRFLRSQSYKDYKQFVENLI